MIDVTGKIVVITGSLRPLTRQEAVMFLEKQGAIVQNYVSAQTDMLIAETTEKVTKELNAKYAKHAKELTEKLAEKDRIISAYQLLAKHTPVAQIPKRPDCPKRPSVLFKA